MEELGNSFVNAAKTLDSYLSATGKDSTTAKGDTTKKDTSAANKNFLVSKLHFMQPQQDQQTGKVNYPNFIGYVLINDTATVDRYLNIPVIRNTFPANLKFLWGKQDRDDEGKLSNG